MKLERQVCEEATKMSNVMCQEELGVIFPLVRERFITYYDTRYYMFKRECQKCL